MWGAYPAFFNLQQQTIVSFKTEQVFFCCSHLQSKHALSFLSQRRTTDTITFLQLCSLYKWISNPLNETRAKGIGITALKGASAALHLHFAMRSAIFRKLFPGGSMDHGQLHALLRKTCPDDTDVSFKSSRYLKGH